MKLPTTIKVVYVAPSSMPVMTSESTHVITNDDDLNVLLSFIEVFHSGNWRLEKLKNHISEAQEKHVSNIRKGDEFLSFSVV